MHLPALTPAMRRTLLWGLVLVALLTAALLAAELVRRVTGAASRIGTPAPPVVTQETVVEQLREVARLVSSEMTLRDVVTYRQTRFGSTKQTLLVVTARVTAGIDLDRGTQIRIDSAAKRIHVTLPPAQVFGVDIVNVRTYDERAGLLNPFRPSDRDAIQQRVRSQLVVAAQQSGILEHADRNAARILHGLLARGGYTVDVARRVTLERPAG
ncbi:MAG TPA: DUF4230 domain-containing protein [Gemmatimonadaceae bacterium]|nr:DUF4230 domain-containing protein [Gemmatimonadaceae bacterium]